MYSMAYTNTIGITQPSSTATIPTTTTGNYLFEEHTDLESTVKLPYVIKKKLLATVGTWNGFVFTPESIRISFDNTDWEEKTNRSLFADHEDLKSKEWIGEVKNVVYEDDSIYGDLVIVDKATAIKLAYGAKFGISPSIDGDVDGNVMTEFVYKNFSVVMNPAIKPAYINFSVDTELEEKNKEPYGDVKYADPGYQEDGVKRYPIDSEDHVRAAWSYINMPKNAEKYNNEQLDNIKNKITKAAKKYDINISEEKMSEEQIKKDKIENSDSSKPEDNKDMQEDKKTEPTAEPDGTGPHGKGMGPGNGNADGSGMKDKENLSDKFSNFADDIKAQLSAISSAMAELNKKLSEQKPVESENAEKEEVKDDSNKDKEDNKDNEDKPKEEENKEAEKSKEFSEDESAPKPEEKKEDDKDKKIEELSQKIIKLEEKLKVPDKKVKKAEYSNRQNNQVSAEEQFEKHLDQLKSL